MILHGLGDFVVIFFMKSQLSRSLQHLSAGIVVACACTVQADEPNQNGITGPALLNEVYGQANPQDDAMTASIAGSGIANMNVAWRSQMQRQLRSIRNRVSMLNGGIACDSPYYDNKGSAQNTPSPYTFWGNTEIDRSKLDGSSHASGYSLNSIGGTAGFAMMAEEGLTVGAAFTGMHGRLGVKGYGSDASGDLDAYYGSMFARMEQGCWDHTLIGSVGFADISLNRRVNIPDESYTTHGNPDGLSVGLMYEVSRSYRLNMDSVTQAWWQPVFNVSYIHSRVDSYTENGGDGALRVGKQESNNVIFGLGARMQGIVGENLFNTPAIMETRLLGKAITGRRDGRANVAMPGMDESATVRGARQGAFGVELGIGLNIPLGRDYGSLILDCSAEMYSHQTTVNGVLGYRFDF